MKFDELLFTYLGEFGRYQKIQFALLCVPPMFVAMQSLSWTFTASSLPCRVSEAEPENVSYWIVSDLLYPPNCTEDPCRYETCRLGERKECPFGYIYDHSEVKNSAINRWDIVCDRAVLKAVIQSMYYLGQMAGSMAFGFLADRIGRKKVLFMALLMLMAAGISMAVAPHWTLFGLLRFFTGFAHPGIFTIGVVIATELVGPSKRKMASVLTGIFFALGQVVLGLSANFLRDYQYLQIAISLPTVIFLVYWRFLLLTYSELFVPESARWLVSLKRYEEADVILRRAARFNKKTMPENWWDQLDSVHEKNDKPQNKSATYGYFDLIKTPVVRKRTLTCFFLWPVSSLYTTFVIGSMSEVPALLFLNSVVDRFGRKPIFAVSYFVAAACMLLFLLNPVFCLNDTLQFLFTKASITICYAVIYMVTPELFPTVIRNLAVGCCSTIARIGAVSASYIAMWIVESYGALAMVIPFGSLALAAGIIVLVLIPETMGQPLPETIGEVEHSEENDEGKELPLNWLL
ncbi:unnamed protein product [Enterobius vermicularis]|uniref:MFS domain-containing protein n=1 Tax=Enterobius vermicularis TaxID=51028 RepID=A0A158QAD0_ENTVE|nr:unnamed protein product [Enterobius vermicularis]